MPRWLNKQQQQQQAKHFCEDKCIFVLFRPQRKKEDGGIRESGSGKDALYTRCAQLEIRPCLRAAGGQVKKHWKAERKG